LRRFQRVFEPGIVNLGQRLQRLDADPAGNLVVGEKFGQNRSGTGDGQPAHGVNGGDSNVVRRVSQDVRERGLQGLDCRFAPANAADRTPETDDAVTPRGMRPVGEFIERFDAHFFGGVRNARQTRASALAFSFVPK